MLVKVKMGDQTLQFDSLENPIAILLTPKDKEAIEAMPREDQLIVSAPLAAMQTKAAEVFLWAKTDWKGATHVNPDNIRTKF